VTGPAPEKDDSRFQASTVPSRPVAEDVVELETEVPGLIVREHTSSDAGAYYELVQANRDHLTRHGDYSELVASTREETERRFASPASADVRCGIWKDSRLIGHMTLVHGEPPRWGLGFWISEDASGRGFMTASLTALLEYARSELGASEVLAGVAHGNHRSSAVLGRLGFVPIAHFPTYTRYQLVLA
jgi:RimJ/RimL family protein N-acetyltransferase